jgi:hypothetical protein
VFVLLGRAGTYFYAPDNKRPKQLAADLVASLCTFAVLYWHRPGNSTVNPEHTATYQFKVTTYAFLLGYGFAVAIKLSFYPDTTVAQGILQWTFVAIHVLPPLLLLTCQGRVKRNLGLRWLSRRGREAPAFELQCTGQAERRGDLIEIEEAIIGGADLNATVLVDSSCSHGHQHDGAARDDYALLHLAVLNGHLDGLQRLLNTGAVEINKPTGRQGRSALFMAAEAGQVHAATMLLEHNADVNALTDEGQSPLIVASARGHKNMVALLEKHGASRTYRWMGLNADDVRAQRVKSSQRHGTRSSSDDGSDWESGRKGTERPLLQGEPGWMETTEQTDSTSASWSPRTPSSGRSSGRPSSGL